MTSKAVACALTSEDLGAQSRSWRELFASAGIDRVQTPDGLRLRFRADAGVADELRRLVAVENECCSWAAWSVEYAREALVVVVLAQGEGIAALHGMFRDLAAAC